MAAVVTKGLTKYYGASRGVEDLSFSVKEGGIFGFLGANGAGKTTTIRLLLGLISPTRGDLIIFGGCIKKNRREILQMTGYLPGELRLYPQVTGERLLAVSSSFYPRGTAGRERALEALELAPKDLHRPFGEYSLGMKQKLGLVQALQHKPRLLILDEPTTGLDPLIRKNVHQLLQEVNREGTTIFLSSHNLSEVEDCCDEVAILFQGRLVVWERLDMMKEKRHSTMTVHFSREIKEEELEITGIQRLSFSKQKAILQVRGDIQAVLKKFSVLPVISLEIRPASLEEIFWEHYNLGVDDPALCHI